MKADIFSSLHKSSHSVDGEKCDKKTAHHLLAYCIFPSFLHTPYPTQLGGYKLVCFDWFSFCGLCSLFFFLYFVFALSYVLSSKIHQGWDTKLYIASCLLLLCGPNSPILLPIHSVGKVLVWVGSQGRTIETHSSKYAGWSIFYDIFCT